MIVEDGTYICRSAGVWIHLHNLQHIVLYFYFTCLLLCRLFYDAFPVYKII
jgi:hypothetical protein